MACQDIRPLQTQDITAWVRRVESSLIYDADNVARPRIHAPNAQCAAQALLFLVRWLFDDHPSMSEYLTDFETSLHDYVGRADVACTLVSLPSLIAAGDNMDIQMYVQLWSDMMVLVVLADLVFKAARE